MMTGNTGESLNNLVDSAGQIPGVFAPQKAKKKKKREKKPGRRQILIPLFMCVICLLMNMGGKMISSTGELPFYFDTPGTITASILGGFIPGISVALLTNLLNFYVDSSSVFFGPLNILIAIVTVNMYRSGKLKHVHWLPLYVVSLTAIGGGIGGIISWYLYGFQVTESTAPMIYFLQDHGVNLFFSYYLTNFVFDFLDKLMTVIFVRAVLYLIPQKFWPKFVLTYWMQEPEGESRETGEKKADDVRMTIEKRVISGLVWIASLLTVICTVICLILFHNYSIEQHVYLATGVAALAASVVDGDSVDLYLSEGNDFDSYRETERLLTNIREDTPDVEYVYVYKIMSDGCHVVFDVDTPNEPGGELGEVVPFDASFMDYLPLLLSGKRVDPIISDDSYGWLLTVYEPVYDSTGECVCYAAVDITMTGLTAYEGDFLARLLCIYMGFLMLVVSFGIWISRFSLVLPIKAIYRVTNEFDYSNEEVRKQNVQRLAKLDISTDDEIEKLYRSLLRATAESTRYFEESRRRLEQIESMESGLVMVLADMVENRDESTGDHVRKTAAYVEVTAQKMQALGYYADQVTDQFVKDAVRSAPLHDIGKIAIPDSILNKPGRLTDEEFAIMKTHAEEGRKIIEQAISTLPDADYLEEARNVAGCHHEKWDGTGYPAGLAGEEIPLSARIMAVADVFDALISKRCYKDAYSYEEAFRIIKEESGTHFDPLVTDAFLRCREEVTEIADRFAEGTEAKKGE